MKTIKNIFKNKELRTKILITLLILVIYKIGTIVKIPTVAELPQNTNSILLLMNYVSGSFLEKFTLFSLGISPYITASIVIQLLGMGVVPAFERWKKEGEKGHKKTEKATLITSIFLGLIESVLLTYVFKVNYNILQDNSSLTFMLTAGMLFGGSLLTLLMARIIDKKGIGNGASLIIFTGIVSRIIYDIYWTGYNIINLSKPYTIGLFILYILFYLVIMGLVIFIDKSVRKIKIEYPKQSNQFSNNQSVVPLKVNLSGVIPVIFAVSILTGFAYIGTFTKIDFFNTIANYNNPIGYIVYVALIIFFAVYYGKEIYNAKTMSDNFRKSNTVVQGKLPGTDTEKFLEKTISHMALFGGISLVIIVTIPIVITLITKTNYNLTLGGTSMMILSGVAIETMSEIKAKVRTIKSKKQSLFE